VTSKKPEWLLWFLGSALFANVVAFFGVNYFDQSRMAWYALIGMICASAAPILNEGLTSNSAKLVVRVQVADGPHDAEKAPYAKLERNK
jgi:hypothetical protein